MIQTGRLDWFKDKVRLALNCYAKRWPAEAQNFARRVKARKDGFSDARCVSPDKEVVHIGMIPRRVQILLDCPEGLTKRMFGSACGTGNASWQREPKMKDAFWEGASALRTSSYRGRAPEHTRESESV